jgi:aminopeptidase N
MAIGFYNMVAGKLVCTHSLELDVDGALTEVQELVGLDCPSLVLLNDGDLTYAKIRLDQESWNFALENLSKLSDPLARAQVWGSAWDATRDGEAPASDFIKLVLSNLAGETQGTMLMTLLRQLLTTTKLYTSDANRHKAIAHVGASLLEMAKAAAPGSDNQLLFTRFATFYAETEASADTIEGLFNGTVKFDGLKLDQDMRWDLINGLVMAGRFTSAQIDVELAKDNTANGAKQAILAQKSIPTAEAKKAGWKDILTNTELSNTDISFGSLGLVRAHDTTLLEPLVDWYFDAVLDVWNSRTFKIAEYIIENAYPIYLANEALAKKTRQFLELNEVKQKPALARIILENLDALERALHAQTKDN